MPIQYSLDSPLLDTEEAARYLRMSPAWLRGSLLTKRIPHRRVGRKTLLFIPAELDRWLKRQTRIETARVTKKARQLRRSKRGKKRAA